MEIGEHIHWFLTDRCNLDCLYCFREHFQNNESEKNLENLAEILGKNVNKVTIGGGEPLLVKGLDSSLKILKDNKIYTSLHTNALLLDKKRIFQLSSLLDEIAIPIDSMDRNTQKELKRNDYLPIFKKVFSDLQNTNLNLCFHTVATYLNIGQIDEIYDFIKDSNFKFWRIYEFNPMLELKTHGNEKYPRINRLEGPYNYRKGLTDGLAAKFILAEEYFEKFNDQRIQFVGLHDKKPPYAFLNTNGDISFYTWFSTGRKVVGNMLNEDFSKIKKKLLEAKKLDYEFDEESFIDSTMAIPIWQRLYEGNFADEELEEICPVYNEQVIHLSELHRKREEKQFLNYE